jgi:hypothetical protein
MPNTHTSVSVARIPDCDIHKHLKGIKGVPAKYDGRTKSGHWANMCQECYQEYGVGLGLGKGQELILDDGSEPNQLKMIVLEITLWNGSKADDLINKIQSDPRVSLVNRIDE